MSYVMNHHILCCKGCVAPKRYPGCHGHCPEYIKEKAVCGVSGCAGICCLRATALMEKDGEVMNYPHLKRYSVYHKKDEIPLIVYATSDECAKAMGIKRNSFYRYICRMRAGKIQVRKWLVYEDEVDEDG